MAFDLNIPFMTRVATLGPVGYSPYAPGTIASLLGFVFFMSLPLVQLQHSVVAIILFVVGLRAAASAEKTFAEKDSGKIVIDELAGYAFATIGLPRNWGFALAAFLLFRFFDILKPLGIKRLERSLEGGASVMADDLLAGIYTNIILQIFLFFQPQLQS